MLFTCCALFVACPEGLLHCICFHFVLERQRTHKSEKAQFFDSASDGRLKLSIPDQQIGKIHSFFHGGFST
jgi:hypothetical protein